MTPVEYLSKNLPVDEFNPFANRLNELGEEGWIVCWMSEIGYQGPSCPVGRHVVFYRPLVI